MKYLVNLRFNYISRFGLYDEDQKIIMDFVGKLNIKFDDIFDKNTNTVKNNTFMYVILFIFKIHIKLFFKKVIIFSKNNDLI